MAGEKKFIDEVLDTVDKETEIGSWTNWEDFCLEFPVPEGVAKGFRIVVFGEDSWSSEKHYSVYINRCDDNVKDFLSESTSRSDLAKALNKAVNWMQGKLAPKKRSKAKYRKGGHILTLDELAAQEFVYWFDKITHRGWFMAWQMGWAMKHIGENGHIFYAVKKEETDGTESSDRS